MTGGDVRDAPLTHAEARTFYDRFGSRQDWQAFYEDAAVERLLVAGRFDLASTVVEFGSGTGRLAERLLRTLLAPMRHTSPSTRARRW
jgi:hypothetical protein